MVGQEKVKPVDAKISAISEFWRPENKKQLMRFPNLSAVTELLTRLLNKRKSLCGVTRQKAFQELKELLNSAPVLAAPDFNAPFKLAVDASDVNPGAVLLQEDNNGVDHSAVTLDFYGGHVSDWKIVIASGILDMLEPHILFYKAVCKQLPTICMRIS